jgi:type 1 fimbria pilin
MIHRCRRLAGLVLLMPWLAQAPRAADLTMQFTGRFDQATCAFTRPDQDLGSFLASSFDTRPQTDWVELDVVASNCNTANLAIGMAFLGTAHATNPQLWAVPTIAGLGIEIQDSQGTLASPNLSLFAWTPGETVYSLRARLTRTGAITAYGRITTPITLQFVYF